MSIIIPQNFMDILKRDIDVRANIDHLCNISSSLFTLNPDFFPDYTFHGIDHINEVLDHADHLIPEKTRSILTPRDIAILVSAITIHDLGMFLSGDGICHLITGNLRKQHIDGLDNCTWDKAWDDYTDRARRYSQEKMRYLFGGNISVDPDCIKKQFFDSDNNRRVIGEFLRQEHPRLAHEIAVNCLPGDSNIYLFKMTSFDETDKDMIGLLARSHGMTIRDTECYCEVNYEKGSKPCNIPIFYLMTVLRIADLLDAGAHRAPKIRENIKKIRVPISVDEWIWNQCITKGRCQWDTEKGKRHIFADPKSSIEYVKLDHWLSRIQEELDICWSVLSEKYPTENYRLSIHRVTSNIHEVGIRNKMNEKFLTKEVKVTANPEIVKLMMEPLYGDNPSYGVRELLQNAVDACIERKTKEHKSHNTAYKGKIIIRLDRKNFSIEDNGIGMDENVLLNYYLSAGSSYRNSDEWKREFEEDGKSQISRIGRFGVGFLASFLLGDDVTVHTQCKDDVNGFYFSFDQNSRPLNVVRLSRPAGIGTTITIRLKEGVYNKLIKYTSQSWHDWYVCEEPIVEYFLDDKQCYPRKPLLPRNLDSRRDWFTLPNTGFESYFWHQCSNYHHDFFCNGIRIYDSGPNNLNAHGLPVPFPDIFLQDLDNQLKVNLARSKVQEIPNWDALIDQVFRFHIARLLLTCWDTSEHCFQNLSNGPLSRYGTQYRKAKFLFSSQGFSLMIPSILSAMAQTKICHLYYENNDHLSALQYAVSCIPEGKCFLITVKNLQANKSEKYREDTASYFLANHLRNLEKSCFDMQVKNRKFFIIDTIIPTLDSIALRQIRHPNGQTENGIWYSEQNMANFPFNPEYFDFHTFPIVAAFELRNKFRPDSRFVKVLCDVLECSPDNLWIPYDMDERHKKFPKAFKELKVYMDYFQASKHQ